MVITSCYLSKSSIYIVFVENFMCTYGGRFVYSNPDLYDNCTTFLCFILSQSMAQNDVLRVELRKAVKTLESWYAIKCTNKAHEDVALLEPGLVCPFILQEDRLLTRIQFDRYAYASLSTPRACVDIQASACRNPKRRKQTFL